MGQCTQSGTCRRDVPAEAVVLQATSATPKGSQMTGALSASSRSEPVVLNIYNLGTSGGAKLLNTVLQPLGMGLFHCGVEIYGREWSFANMSKWHVAKLLPPGKGELYAITGVFCSVPGQCEGHSFSQSVGMGRTETSESEVFRVLQLLRVQWLVEDYHPLTRNCCHFCDDLCQRLRVGAVPSWAVSMAKAGAAIAEQGDMRCCQEVARQTAQSAEFMAESFCCRPRHQAAGVVTSVLVESVVAQSSVGAFNEREASGGECDGQLLTGLVQL
mmetsp:Transcript_5651/g.18229  ORF Transcript_5651/g.18229 Transcript_5651/m.18229 type:complete len:272 (+) Transcript_5651:92-907(+)